MWDFVGNERYALWHKVGAKMENTKSLTFSDEEEEQNKIKDG